jgi:hypothetical protein
MISKPPDLTNAEGARWFAEHLKEAAADFMRQRGQVNHMAVVIGTRNPKTRLKTAKPHLMPVLVAGIDDGNSKEGAVAAIKKLAAKAGAVAVGFMAEAWGAYQTEEEYQAYRRTAMGTIHQHPKRIELLMVSWEHRAGTPRMGSAKAVINRHADGKFASLGPWEELPVEGGRFVEWLEDEPKGSEALDIDDLTKDWDEKPTAAEAEELRQIIDALAAFGAGLTKEERIEAIKTVAARSEPHVAAAAEALLRKLGQI